MPERTLAPRDALQAFESAGAFLRGHFVYTSGGHGADYLENFRILEDPRATMQLAAMVAGYFHSSGVHLVAGPTTGGIILAYEVARQLGVETLYVERGERGGRGLRRGFLISPGARVLGVGDGGKARGPRVGPPGLPFGAGRPVGGGRGLAGPPPGPT